MKYHIGQTVIVRKGELLLQKYPFTSCMDEYRGMTCKITDIYENDWYKIDIDIFNNCYHYSWLKSDRLNKLKRILK